VRFELPPADAIACDYCAPLDRGPIADDEHGARLRAAAHERNARLAGAELPRPREPDPSPAPPAGRPRRRGLRLVPGGVS
jgi:hypothetical protein